jgi:DeoR family transcriptional regulator, fructose operon transcriptional repressor
MSVYRSVVGVSSNLASEERLAWLRDQLDKHGVVKISPAAKHFDVSEMTIRRDLLELESLGMARRVRGGAVAVLPVAFEGRHQARAKAKTRIAAKVRPLIPGSGAIGLDASSTLVRLATALDRARELLVITNGYESFVALQDKPGITATLTGGNLDPRTGSLNGPLACRAASSLLLNKLFLSAAAVDASVGSSETSVEEAEVKRAMVAVAGEIVLCVDSSKLGTRSIVPVVEWDQVSLLVTELEPSDARLKPYRKLVDIL